MFFEQLEDAIHRLVEITLTIQIQNSEDFICTLSAIRDEVKHDVFFFMMNIS